MSEEQAEYRTKPEDQGSEGGKPQEFKNLREVAGFLKGQGWKVSQSTLYKHQGEGKIKAEPDGTYTFKSVMRYAKAYLTTLEVKRKAEDEELQRRKTLAEIRRIDEQAKLAQIQRMKEEGKYILLERFELELASRAAVLEAGLKFMIEARAGEWIDLVGGDHERTADFIRSATTALNDALNQFATLKEFHVVFVEKDKSRQDQQDRLD